MARLMFCKTGNAIWISHLDLMRLFQRAFKRANLHLKHTQGYNPRASVSIALPLSVGISSNCELLDFELDDIDISCAEIKERLNKSLISGITVLDVYESGAKIRELALLSCRLQISFVNQLTEETVADIRNLFSAPALIVPKKTKNGMQDQDIIPMIRRISVKQAGECTLQIDCLICCQNPTLNPMQICAAIQREFPQLQQQLCVCTRLEIYKNNEEIFR